MFCSSREYILKKRRAIFRESVELTDPVVSLHKRDCVNYYLIKHTRRIRIFIRHYTIVLLKSVNVIYGTDIET